MAAVPELGGSRSCRFPVLKFAEEAGCRASSVANQRGRRQPNGKMLNSRPKSSACRCVLPEFFHGRDQVCLDGSTNTTRIDSTRQLDAACWLTTTACCPSPHSTSSTTICFVHTLRPTACTSAGIVLQDQVTAMSQKMASLLGKFEAPMQLGEHAVAGAFVDAAAVLYSVYFIFIITSLAICHTAASTPVACGSCNCVRR